MKSGLPRCSIARALVDLAAWSLLDIRAIRWMLALWLGYRAEDILCDVEAG
jgi:hypothetical protein